MLRNLVTSAALILFSLTLSGQEGYEIKISIENYDGDQLLLAYPIADKTYIRDSCSVNSDGSFVFRGDEPLESGIYMVAMTPGNDYFQILIDENEQQFSLVTQADDPISTMVFKGKSEDNQLYYKYLNYLDSKRAIAGEFNKELEDMSGTEAQRIEAQNKIDELTAEVLKHQKQIISNHPATLTAAIIKANITLEYPEYKGSEEEINMKRWRYTQNHYFDRIDLADGRLLRTPFLFQDVTFFVEKLQVANPDSISKAIDFVLTKMEASPETYKIYLIHFLNSYAKSPIVGMDAVYVHLAKNYYGAGKAAWTEEEQLQKIVDNATVLEPLLLGKTAPDMKLKKLDLSDVTLHTLNSKFKVLYFWKAEISQKELAGLKTFYDKYNPGIQIIAVCMNELQHLNEAMNFIEENQIGDWVNVYPADNDTYADIIKTYDLRRYPQLFLLDENDVILSKRIGSDQLESVIMYHLSDGSN